jgi:hypothetical protein
MRKPCGTVSARALITTERSFGTENVTVEVAPADT